MVGKKKLPITVPRPPPPKLARPKIPVAMMIRMFLIGSIAVVASGYAIWRHYTVARPRMLAPVPSSSASEIEIEVPPPETAPAPAPARPSN